MPPPPPAATVEDVGMGVSDLIFCLSYPRISLKPEWVIYTGIYIIWYIYMVGFSMSVPSLLTTSLVTLKFRVVCPQNGTAVLKR